MNTGEIILYQPDDKSTQIEVRVSDETIWLTQNQIVGLFDSSKANVSEHIKNILHSKELEAEATVRKFRTVQMEGNRNVIRNIDHYNLDMIISIGYRINTIRGTQFRIWANKVLKDFQLNGYALNNRMERIEKKLHEHDLKFDLLINTNLTPKEGIFYDGQIFDAYVFVTNLVRSAKNSIVLIDNYVDESILLILSKRATSVSASIYTNSITPQLKTDLIRFNAHNPK